MKPPKKKKIDSGKKKNLPYLTDDLVELIVESLDDMKQFVRFSTVAKRFRHCYRRSQNLNFDWSFFKCIQENRVSNQPTTWHTTQANHLADQHRYRSIVGRLIDEHDGPSIRSLKLSISPEEKESYRALVAGWIDKAGRKGVQELDLDFGTWVTLKTGVFEIESLEILRLKCCSFILPPIDNFRITGLQLLRVCFLRYSQFDAILLKAMSERCLELEILELVDCFITSPCLEISAANSKKFKLLRIKTCHKITKITVEAPALVTFHYSGQLLVFEFKDVAKLTDVILDFKPRGTIFKADPSVLDNLMRDLSKVEILTATSGLLEGLCTKFRNGEVRETFFKLSMVKEIQLAMEGSKNCDLFTIASFLKNCPFLERIFIDIVGWFKKEEEVGDQQLLIDTAIDPCYPNLKQLKLAGFRFESREMQLLHHFLEKGSNLEIVAIFLAIHRSRLCAVPEESSFNEQLRTVKASPKAWIYIFQHCQEKLLYPATHPKNWYKK